MDKVLVRLIIGSIIFGLAKATCLKTTSGKEFLRPEIVPSPKNGGEDSFGIINPEDSTEIFYFSISDVETIY